MRVHSATPFILQPCQQRSPLTRTFGCLQIVLWTFCLLTSGLSADGHRYLARETVSFVNLDVLPPARVACAQLALRLVLI